MKGRFLRAIKTNIPYYLAYLVVFIAIVIVLLTTESGRKALAE